MAADPEPKRARTKHQHQQNRHLKGTTHQLGPETVERPKNPHYYFHSGLPVLFRCFAAKELLILRDQRCLSDIVLVPSLGMKDIADLDPLYFVSLDVEDADGLDSRDIVQSLSWKQIDMDRQDLERKH
jgi:hypothetical protein